MAASDGPAAQVGHGREAQFLELVFADHQAYRGGVVLAAGVPCGDGAVAHHRAQAGQRLHIGVGAGGLIFLEWHRVAAALGNGDGHDLLVEPALVLGGNGALVAAESVLVLLLPGDFVLAGQVFRGLHHAAGDGAETLLGGDGDAGAGQPVVESDRAVSGAPTGLVAVELGVAHTLDTAGDYHIGVLGLHQHAGVQDGLQAGGAAAVQLVSGHLYGQPRLQAC